MDNKNQGNQNPIQSNQTSPLGASPTPTPVVQPEVPQQATVVSEPVSSVVVQEKKEGLPIWFYLLFAVVALVFFFITALLVKTLIEKRNTPQAGIITLSPTPQPASSPVPTVIPTPEDEYLNSVNSASESDELTSIDSDLDKTDTSELKKDLLNLDASVNP